MRKRGIQFYWHFLRMNQRRLHETIITRWFTETCIHMEKIGNKQEDIHERVRYRQMISDFKAFQTKLPNPSFQKNEERKMSNEWNDTGRILTGKGNYCTHWSVWQNWIAYQCFLSYVIVKLAGCNHTTKVNISLPVISGNTDNK